MSLDLNQQVYAVVRYGDDKIMSAHRTIEKARLVAFADKRLCVVVVCSLRELKRWMEKYGACPLAKTIQALAGDAKEGNEEFEQYLSTLEF